VDRATGLAQRVRRSLPARPRLTAARPRAPSEDSASSGGPTRIPKLTTPTAVVTTVNAKPAMATGRLTITYRNSAQVRLLSGSRSSHSTAGPLSAGITPSITSAILPFCRGTRLVHATHVAEHGATFTRH